VDINVLHDEIDAGPPLENGKYLLLVYGN